MIRAAILVLLFTLLTILPSFAQSPPATAPGGALTLYLNNEAVTPLPPLFKTQQTLYLPIQVVSHLGVRVEINAADHSARLVMPGKVYLVKEGSRYITWQQEGFQIAHAPIWQQNTLYVPSTMFVYLGAVLRYNSVTNEIHISKPMNTIRTLNLLPSDVYTRLVFEFEQAPMYKVSESENQITIDLFGAQVPEPEQFQQPVSDVLYGGIQISRTGTGTVRMVIRKKYPAPHRLFWLESPHRLMIDLVKIFQEEKTSQLAPGVSYTHTYQGQAFGPVTHYTVKIQPGSNFFLEPVLAKEGQTDKFTKEPVSTMARRHDALVAINTTYFNAQGIPLGILMKEQELISSPLYNRTLLGITRQQRLFVDQTSLSEAVYFPELRNTQRFHAVNLPRQQQQMVLYTPRYGRTTGTAENEYAFEAQILLDGTIQQTGTHNLPIPEDGYVISAHGKPALWLQQNIAVGMRALIFSQVLGQWRDRDIEHLISGGPRLLKQGQPHVTAEQEQFKPDIAVGRAPRTALGIGPNGEIILLVVDGRQQRSAGLTLWELAQLLKERGAVEGINFDGGGSSALAIRGKLVNNPSDKSERPVSSALLVLPNAQRQSRAAY